MNNRKEILEIQEKQEALVYQLYRLAHDKERLRNPAELMPLHYLLEKDVKAIVDKVFKSVLD